MDIKENRIKIKDIIKGYVDETNTNGGIFSMEHKLNIRPSFQRNFVYNEKQREEVIKTILERCPLNVMYWSVECIDDNQFFEVLDGQQRTISICQFLNNKFSIEYEDMKLKFNGLPKNIRDQILNYELLIYKCEGKISEKLNWFKIINIAGEKLSSQELRNAFYSGEWLDDAKKFFSLTNCPGAKIAKELYSVKPIRQELLENALKWIANSMKSNIQEYMANNQSLGNAKELKDYFISVCKWVNEIFYKNKTKEMKFQQWGIIYNKHKDDLINKEEINLEVKKLLMDEEVQNKKGIYVYVFDRDEKNLSIRVFPDHMKTQKFNEQNGLCNICNKEFNINSMEADHIKPWSKGGKTIIENCQILCRECNRKKSDK